ncbi:amidase domain-containing protein [Mycolicibacterium sp. Dal123E01]|uniref:amidase domain-containing protein n=1 Tax=Mycolicibacterium sp. Dal123E01 TaxID=3457578 RepID=UPI00403E5E97
MPAVADTGIPSLSQILAWGTKHLSQAAADWEVTAEHWESTFTNVHNGTLSPGGTTWSGVAADAAQERALADLVKVRGLADGLQEAATIARRGVDQLDYLKTQAIDAVNAARGAKFTVSENLAVLDTSGSKPPRIGAAQQHATTIAARAAALSTADNEVAAKITAATAELTHHGFSDDEDKTAQALDSPTAPADPYGGLSEARRRALEYADRWAGNAGDPHRANPDYENFGDGGGDCTNFASQVMRAGGFRDAGDGIDDWHRGDADDWYYNNGLHIPGNENSNTWSVAQANRDFIVNSGRGHVVGTSPMPANLAALDPLAPSKAGLMPGDLIYYHDEATGTINHTAVYLGQQLQGGRLVDVVDQHANGANNFHNDWMPDGSGFNGGSASSEFVHLTYPGE